LYRASVPYQATAPVAPTTTTIPTTCGPDKPTIVDAFMYA